MLDLSLDTRIYIFIKVLKTKDINATFQFKMRLAILSFSYIL